MVFRTICAFLLVHSASAKSKGKPPCPDAGGKLSVLIKNVQLDYGHWQPYYLTCTTDVGSKSYESKLTIPKQSTNVAWNFYVEYAFPARETPKSATTTCMMENEKEESIEEDFDADFRSVNAEPYSKSETRDLGKLKYGPPVQLHFEYTFACFLKPVTTAVPVTTAAPVTTASSPVDGGWACPTRCESLEKITLPCNNPAPQNGGQDCPLSVKTPSPCGAAAGCSYCRIPNMHKGINLSTTGRNYMRANFFPGFLTCALHYVGKPAYGICTTSGSEITLSGCEAVCAQPRGVGYVVSNVVEQTSDNPVFTFPTVTCAEGYTGTAQVSKCAKAGEPYHLSGCTKVSPPKTTKAPTTSGETERTDAKPDESAQAKVKAENQEKGFSAGLVMGIIIPIVILLSIVAFIAWHYHGDLSASKVKPNHQQTKRNAPPSSDGNMARDTSLPGSPDKPPVHSHLYSFAASLLRLNQSQHACNASQLSKSMRSKPEVSDSRRTKKRSRQERKSELHGISVSEIALE